jgi:hypothetical protein
MEIGLRRQLLNAQMELFRRGFCFEGDGSACLLLAPEPVCKRPIAPRICSRSDARLRISGILEKLHPS